MREMADHAPLAGSLRKRWAGGPWRPTVSPGYGGSTCDVLVTQGLFQFWVGNDLLRTVARTTPGAEIRKKHAERKAPL